MDFDSDSLSDFSLNSDSSNDSSPDSSVSQSTVASSHYNTASSSGASHRYSLRNSSVSSFMSTQSQSDSSGAGPSSQRDLDNRGRRSTTRSTRASNSTATDRSRSPHFSSDSSPTPVPTRHYQRRTRSSLASSSSSNSDLSSLGRPHQRMSLSTGRNTRRQANNSDSSFSTAAGESDTSNQGHTSGTQEEVEETDSDTEIYIPPNMNVSVGGANNGHPVHDEEDDDVILVPQEIETIDLCTQPVGLGAIPAPPRRYLPEVIEIFDSPTIPAVQRVPTIRVRDRAAPVNINNNNTTPPARRQSLDFDTSTQALSVKMQCPICLDGVAGKNPLSTICGHIFCGDCLTTWLEREKKCPQCKKALRSRSHYHRIFI